MISWLSSRLGRRYEPEYLASRSREIPYKENYFGNFLCCDGTSFYGGHLTAVAENYHLLRKVALGGEGGGDYLNL